MPRYIIFNYRTERTLGEVTLSQQSAEWLNRTTNKSKAPLVLIRKHETRKIAISLSSLARQILMELEA